MARRKTGRANGYGTLEVHGRTFRARYFKADPKSPSGFSRVTEGTGIRVDGSAPEDVGDDGRPDPRRARARAERWLEERTAPYRRTVEAGGLKGDAAAIAGTLKVALARVNGELEDKEHDREAAEDRLPAFTFGQAWDAFDGCLESRQRDPSTQRNYGQWYHMFVRWMGKRHPEMQELRDVTTPVAREYAAYLMKSVRGTTYNRHLNSLALVWATLAARDPDGRPAYPDARLKSNPFSYNRATKSGIPRIKLEKSERPHRRRDLSLEEIGSILGRATGEMRVLIALGFYTGLRLGDCATLKVSNFDRAIGVINRRSKKTDMETTTAIHPCLARILQEEVTARSGYILPEIAEMYTQERYASEFRESHAELGEKETREAIDRRRSWARVELTRRIARLFRECGIETSFRDGEDDRARPDAGFHSLRHSFDTQLERARVALKDRQAAMGHATTAMTEYYTHANQGAALALPDLMADGTDTERQKQDRVAQIVSMLDELTESGLRQIQTRIEKILGYSSKH